LRAQGSSRTGIGALALAVALAGCGSGAAAGGGSSVPAAPTPGTAAPAGPATRTQFISRADAICTALAAQQAPLQQRSLGLSRESPSARKQLAALSAQTVKLALAADAKLAALPRPPGEAGTIENLLSGYDQEARDVSELTQGLKDNESSLEETAVGSLNRAATHDRSLARQLGLSACSSA